MTGTRSGRASTDRSLSGALLVQEQAVKHGRPIELSGGEDAGWVDRATVEQLIALSLVPNKVMTLTTADLRQFSVIFDRSGGAPVEAQQIMPFAYPDDSYQYSLSIRLLTVQTPAA